MGSYELYIFSNIAIFVALATLLHLQFGKTGIVNFGVVGFFGLGMYSFGVFLIQFNIPYVPSLIFATILSGLAAYGLGGLVLRLDSQAVLVATLAFATIIEDLSILQKGLTNGVIGLGSIPFPIDAGLNSQLVFFVIAVIIAALLILYARQLGKSPFGRLLMSIQDNEPLSISLGKRTFHDKLLFFSITSALMGFLGTMYASNVHFLVPRMLGPATTFTVWIALIIGGRKTVLGGLVGVLVTVGIFDFIIETYVPIPSARAQLLPIIKMMVYGLTLLLVIMFKPAGLLSGGHKKLTAK
ncbi:MAG: branched-chain amino acid ABC transporter permease [Spirochaetales bacterium]|jgi:branched-chain amino acid transport system permease protein|nr:branched-chain amino acid ABC transporter permease [Spirochaetales bacterium]